MDKLSTITIGNPNGQWEYENNGVAQVNNLLYLTPHLRSLRWETSNSCQWLPKRRTEVIYTLHLTSSPPPAAHYNRCSGKLQDFAYADKASNRAVDRTEACPCPPAAVSAELPTDS